MRAVQHGYVVVVQDVRGRFTSEGTFDAHFQEWDEGVDVIAWAAQPWSSGVVGMFGGSYLGCTQWIPAREQPAALRALAPAVTPSDAYEERDDVLVYSTPVVERPVEVTGPIELVLFEASSARDTDFTGKLVDVFPDGRAIILTDGILRVRYRGSFMEPEPLEPDAVYEVRLTLWATANEFWPGHRIRLEVSSSNFQRFGQNSTTGGDIAHETPEANQSAINHFFT